jgi:hypothetical protein
MMRGCGEEAEQGRLRKGHLKLPQLGENNTPRLVDAVGECLLYYEIRRNVRQL